MPLIWLSYFLISIMVIGFCMSMFFFFPLRFLSRWFPRLTNGPSYCMQKGIRLLMWIQPWFKAEVQLDWPKFEGGTLIVGNHRSTLDVFILLSRIQGIRIMGRDDLYKIPFLGMMMKASRQIRVERNRLDSWVKGMEHVRVSLEKGDTVHIFPEMTRCPQGYSGLMDFVSAPFLAAIQARAQVVPVVFENTDGVWPKGVAGISFGVPVKARALPPLAAADFKTADELKQAVRKKMLEAMA